MSKTAFCVAPRCRAPLQKKEEGNSPFLSRDVSSLNPTVPSGAGREKMPREKKLLVGSLLAGSLGIALAIVACIIGIFFAGIICGCIAIATGIAGIVTSTKAMKEGKRGGLTMAALIVSIVSVGFGAIILILSIISAILATMAAVA